MAGVKGPLFGLTAQGQIGKTLVYARWRGIQYARTYVIPANPQSADQVEVRDAFAYLQAIYPYLGTEAQAVQTEKARGRPFTNRNAWTSLNATPLRADVDLADLRISSGQSPIPLVVSPTFTPAAGQVTFAGTAPSAPSGWTITSAIGVVVADSDPTTPPYVLVADEGEDLTSPYSIVVSGLAAGDYLCSMFIKATSTGTPTQIRYGPDTTSLETVT